MTHLKVAVLLIMATDAFVDCNPNLRTDAGLQNQEGCVSCCSDAMSFDEGTSSPGPYPATCASATRSFEGLPGYTSQVRIRAATRPESCFPLVLADPEDTPQNPSLLCQ